MANLKLRCGECGRITGMFRPPLHEMRCTNLVTGNNCNGNLYLIEIIEVAKITDNRDADKLFSRLTNPAVFPTEEERKNFPNFLLEWLDNDIIK